MTEKQRLFAEIFYRLGDCRKSALLAGYSEKNADKYCGKLLENKEILQYISSLSKSESKKDILTAGQCKAVLSQIVRDEENTPSERMKAIDLLIGIDDEVKEDSHISISVNYGETNEVSV